MSILVPTPARHPVRGRGTLALAGLLLALAGCSRDTVGEGPAWLAAHANPVKLALTLDAGRAVSRTVTPNGGTLAVTGADGTRYRLSIPAGALLSDARITVTPVSAVKGLPLRGGSVAAVQLEPDGLRLMQPATLSIRTEADVPVAEQVAFGYYGAGEDAHRYPLEADPRQITMKLYHFSGYGFGRAAPDDPGRLALQEASASEARLNARIAGVLEQDRESGDARVSETAMTRVYELLGEYYDAILQPLMRRAETDDRLATCCAQRYWSWARRAALLGGEEDGASVAAGLQPAYLELQRRVAEGDASMRRILENAFAKGVERASRQCREEHDFSAISTMLRLSRQAALLGYAAVASQEQVAGEIRRCMRFEVEFQSSFDNRGPAGTQLVYHVGARVPVQVELFGRSDEWRLGSAPLEYVRFDARGNPKEEFFGKDTGDDRAALWEAVTSARITPRGTRPGTFVVRAIDWALNPIDAPGVDCDGKDVVEQTEAVTSVRVVFSPGTPTEITHVVPNRDLFGVGPFDQDDTMWAIHWANAHRREQIKLPGLDDPDSEIDGIYAVDLARSSEAGVWRQDFRRPDPGVNGWSLAEDGFVLLRHTPN